MLLIERARVDHLCHTHAGVEWRTGKRHKLVKVGAKQDILTGPFLFEAALDLDTELARAVCKILTTGLALTRARGIQDAHEHPSGEMLRVDLVRVERVVQPARLHMPAVRPHFHFQTRHGSFREPGDRSTAPVLAIAGNIGTMPAPASIDLQAHADVRSREPRLLCGR